MHPLFSVPLTQSPPPDFLHHQHTRYCSWHAFCAQTLPQQTVHSLRYLYLHLHNTLRIKYLGGGVLLFKDRGILFEAYYEDEDRYHNECTI